MSKKKVISEKYIENYFSVDTEEAKEIIEQLERIVYDSNQAIITIGEEADGLYFLEEGQATVFNADGDAVNEMEAGQCFGEYAILSGEPRMTTVKAHGRVVAYRMSSEDFLAVVAKHPQITGKLIKSVYGQVSAKHAKLLHLTHKNRGIMWAPSNEKDGNLLNIIITYGITFLIFIAVYLLSPSMDSFPVWWQLLPIVFLMGFVLKTRRILEGLILTTILLAGMLYGGNFIGGFSEMLISGIANEDTAQTMMIMAMVEAVAALLASAGVVSAFKKLADKYIKSKPGSLFAMLMIMIVVCLDECLNVATAGYCMNDAVDKHKVPRESRALLGSFSTAICSIIPFSLWGAYICGWMGLYSHDGGRLYLQSVPYNLAGGVAFVFAFMLCMGVLPKSKQIKEAYKRIKAGGTMWPEGSEEYFDTEINDGVVGKPINLLLPMLVWAVSATLCGTIAADGKFSIAPTSGLVITLIFMFFLYVGQKIMTPKDFFEIMAEGIKNALIPMLLLILSQVIAQAMLNLEFDSLLETIVPKMVGGQLYLIPALLFIIFTLCCAGLGSSWGMYCLGIPMAVYMSNKLSINLPLVMGSVLSAGVAGESLCPYLDESSPVVTAIGCGPKSYRKVRIRYWIPMCIICVIGYLILGAYSI